MKKTKISLTVVFISIFILAGILFAMGNKADFSGKSQNNVPAIDFTLTDLDGYYIALSDFKGKVVFLNFFATWCPPCRDEMPSMQKLHEELDGEDFVMVAVSVDKGSIQSVKDFIEKNNYTFKVLHDKKGEAAYNYNVRSIPATYLIDKNGIIAGRIIGSRDWMEPRIVKHLRELVVVDN